MSDFAPRHTDLPAPEIHIVPLKELGSVPVTGYQHWLTSNMLIPIRFKWSMPGRWSVRQIHLNPAPGALLLVRIKVFDPDKNVFSLMPARQANKIV